MSRRIDVESFGEFVELLSEAEDLIKLAEERAERAESAVRVEAGRVIVTEKRASALELEKVAGVLVRTGFCKAGTSAAKQLLREDGESGLLRLVEKLASTAIFPVDFSFEAPGELVEKNSTNLAKRYEGTDSSTAAWLKARDEVMSGLS